MPNPNPHCSLNYHQFGPNDLDTFSHAVGEGIYTHNPPFATPPLTQTAFETLAETFHDKYEAFKNGGRNQKGEYITARTNLVAGLDTTSEYVDNLSGVNDDMIILAGYTPTKTGETKTVVPDTPVIDTDRTKRGTGLQIIAECRPVAGAEYYGMIVSEGQALSTNIHFTNDAIVFNASVNNRVAVIVSKGRKKVLNDLTAGINYYIYFYAGNSAGVSILSTPVIVMAAQ